MTIVLFDLDETIIDGRVINILALRYGFYYELNRIRTNLKNKLLTYEEATKSIIKLLKGKNENEIIKIVQSIPLMLNFDNMIISLKIEGFELGIVTDGLNIISNYFAKKFGFDYSIGHNVEILDGKLTGNVHLVKSNKNYLNWKKEVVKRIRRDTNSKIIAVGNGDIDVPMLKEADLGIAFNATDKAKDSADIIIKNKDMNEVLKVIELHFKKFS